jgi:hypothetical protein
VVATNTRIATIIRNVPGEGGSVNIRRLAALDTVGFCRWEIRVERFSVFKLVGADLIPNSVTGAPDTRAVTSIVLGIDPQVVGSPFFQGTYRELWDGYSIIASSVFILSKVHVKQSHA